MRRPGFALKYAMTQCSMAIVTLRSTCNSTAASNDVLNASMDTRPEYSTKRFSTTRSIRIAVK